MDVAALHETFLPLALDTDRHTPRTDRRSCLLPLLKLDDVWNVGTSMVVVPFLRDELVVSLEHVLP